MKSNRQYVLRIIKVYPSYTKMTILHDRLICLPLTQTAPNPRALQYNAQPLPVPGLPPGTSLLTVLPQTLARINHSCYPNAAFTFSIQDSNCIIGTNINNPELSIGNIREEHRTGDANSRELKRTEDENRHVESGKEVVVWLTCIRPVASGEEICVSYLNQLCTPSAARRQMLQGAFNFECQCERCVRESSIEGEPHPVDDMQLRCPQSYSSSSVSVSGGNQKGQAYPSFHPSSSVSDTSLSSVGSHAEIDPVRELRCCLEEILNKSEFRGSAETVGERGRDGNRNRILNDIPSITVDNLLSINVINSLLHQSELAISKGNITPDATYVIHDSGMLVLKSVLEWRKILLLEVEDAKKPGRRDPICLPPPPRPLSLSECSQGTNQKTGTGTETGIVIGKMTGRDGTTRMTSMEVDNAILRAVALVAQCWSLIGCGVGDTFLFVSFPFLSIPTKTSLPYHYFRFLGSSILIYIVCRPYWVFVRLVLCVVFICYHYISLTLFPLFFLLFQPTHFISLYTLPSLPLSSTL